MTITKNMTIVDSLPDGLEYAGSYSISGGKVLGFTQNGKVLTWIVTDVTTTTPMIITTAQTIKIGMAMTNSMAKFLTPLVT